MIIRRNSTLYEFTVERIQSLMFYYGLFKTTINNSKSKLNLSTAIRLSPDVQTSEVRPIKHNKEIVWISGSIEDVAWNNDHLTLELACQGSKWRSIRLNPGVYCKLSGALTDLQLSFVARINEIDKELKCMAILMDRGFLAVIEFNAFKINILDKFEYYSGKMYKVQEKIEPKLEGWLVNYPITTVLHTSSMVCEKGFTKKYRLITHNIGYYHTMDQLLRRNILIDLSQNRIKIYQNKLSKQLLNYHYNGIEGSQCMFIWTSDIMNGLSLGLIYELYLTRALFDPRYTQILEGLLEHLGGSSRISLYFFNYPAPLLDPISVMWAVGYPV